MYNWIDWVVFGVFCVTSLGLAACIVGEAKENPIRGLLTWISLCCALFILACSTPTEPVRPSCHYTGSDGLEYECGTDTVKWVEGG